MKVSIRCVFLALLALLVAPRVGGQAVIVPETNMTDDDEDDDMSYPIVVKGKGGKGMRMGKGKGKGGSMEPGDGNYTEPISPSTKMPDYKGHSMSKKSEGMGTKAPKSSKAKGSFDSPSKKSKGDGKEMSKKMKKKKMGKGKGKGKGGGGTPVAPTPQPTLGPGETHAPTLPPSELPTVSVTYSLFYTILQFRLPNQGEFEAVLDLTRDHVTPFFVANAESNSQYTLQTATTVIADTQFNLGEPVEIKYTSTLIYTQNSVPPSVAALKSVVTTAFSGSNLNDYFNEVDGLSSANIFSTVTAITLDTNVSTRSVSSSSGASTTSRIILGAGLGAGTAVLVIAALALSGRRRQKREEDRQKAAGSVGHVTAGELTFDSHSATEHVDESAVEETDALEEVVLEEVRLD